MKHYRVNKVTKPNGQVIKKKDIIAQNDSEAITRADQDEDCPTCEVWQAGHKVGSIV